MVSFMEEHGDLSRAPLDPKDPQVKISHLRKWQQLTAMLNSDVSGEAKNTTRWKKVWNDFKNNTRKKLQAIQKANAQGQPATRKLSDIELRTLNVIGIPVIVANDIEALEDSAWSFDEETTESKPEKSRRDSTVYRIETLDTDQEVEKPEVKPKLYHRESTIHEEPSVDHNYHVDTPKSPVPIISDEYWKRFRVQQHQDYLSLRKEENKIRKMEIKAQLGWQELGNRAVDLLGKLVEKYCEEQ